MLSSFGWNQTPSSNLQAYFEMKRLPEQRVPEEFFLPIGMPFLLGRSQASGCPLSAFAPQADYCDARWTNNRNTKKRRPVQWTEPKGRPRETFAYE